MIGQLSNLHKAQHKKKQHWDFSCNKTPHKYFLYIVAVFTLAPRNNSNTDYIYEDREVSSDKNHNVAFDVMKLKRCAAEQFFSKNPENIFLKTLKQNKADERLTKKHYGTGCYAGPQTTLPVNHN